MPNNRDQCIFNNLPHIYTWATQEAVDGWHLRCLCSGYGGDLFPFPDCVHEDPRCFGWWHRGELSRLRLHSHFSCPFLHYSYHFATHVNVLRKAQTAKVWRGLNGMSLATIGSLLHRARDSTCPVPLRSPTVPSLLFVCATHFGNFKTTTSFPLLSGLPPITFEYAAFQPKS